MANFELDIVHCLNRYFEDNGCRGYAYRLKQSKFSSQYVDVLSDSLDPRYYLSVECKSLIGKKLYFTQHFHADKNGVHQVDAISEFIRKTGRRGYLAVEFRSGGKGQPNRAFLIPWSLVTEIRSRNSGITIDDLGTAVELKRIPKGYLLDNLYPDSE